MSRIGNNPINIPEGVNIDIQSDKIVVKGKMGELTQDYSDVIFELDDNFLTVKRPSDSKDHRAKHGLYRALVNNMVEGVSKGFTKELEIRGVGYQASNQGKYIVLQLGYSHDIYFEPPEGITISANKTEIIINGTNKQLVGEVAAKIRSFRKPEPYKGKGIRYKDEYVISKQGKTVGGSGS